VINSRALSTGSPPVPPPQVFQKEYCRKAFEVYQPQYLTLPPLAGDGLGILHLLGYKWQKRRNIYLKNGLKQ